MVSGAQAWHTPTMRELSVSFFCIQLIYLFFKRKAKLFSYLALNNMFVSLNECFSPGVAGGWEPGSVYVKFVSPSQLLEQMLYGVVGGRGKKQPHTLQFTLSFIIPD